MKRIKFHHFLGDSLCTSISEVQTTLRQSAGGVNDFFITRENTFFPICL